MVLQFGTFIFVARRLSSQDLGIYYEAFGLLNTTYFLAGLGLPDGLVRYVARAAAVGDRSQVRGLVVRSGAITAGLTLLTGSVAALCLWHQLSGRLLLLVTVWWLCYGILFFGSQALVAVGITSWGAFFFYPASSVALFATTVPYLLWTLRPTIKGTLMATAIGAAICAVAAISATVWYLRPFPASSSRHPIRPLLRLGSVIAITRVLQTSLYWIPVWAMGAAHGAAAAGTIGTASRLNAGIAAVMGAVRFTIRPLIVRHAATGNWQGIARESRKVATVASICIVAAFIGTLGAGAWAIGLVFGRKFQAAAPILAVFLVGTLGECIGGPVDEILRMTGKADWVLGVLAVCWLSEGCLAWIFASRREMALAAIQSLVSVAMYSYLLWLVWRLRGIYVGADFRITFETIETPPQRQDAA
jgi:O-antigen/teichoic acid export membrane protein